MSATTAPDFRLLVKDVPRLRPEPGVALDLLVLAAGVDRCAGVELGSGALVRAWYPQAPQVAPAPYDLVTGTVDFDPEAVPDPSEPEALVFVDAPEPIGRMAGRRAERLLRPLVHPAGAPLLSSHAPAVPFWERSAAHPSVALVEPESQVVLRREPAYLGCRFTWQGKVRELPCLDQRLAATMDRVGQVRRVADRRVRLVIAFTPPIDGHCHKVVEAVLDRP